MLEDPDLRGRLVGITDLKSSFVISGVASDLGPTIDAFHVDAVRPHRCRANLPKLGFDDHLLRTNLVAPRSPRGEALVETVCLAAASFPTRLFAVGPSRAAHLRGRHRGPTRSREVTVPLTLTAAARIIGGYVWLEERLFEILGAWVPSTPEPDVKLHLAVASHHHAWHASLWRDRLPELREIDGESFVTPPGPGLEAWVALASSAATSTERLVGLYRVLLPHQMAAYRGHLERASAITDGPTIRALTLVLADDRADRAEGERLVRSLPDPDSEPTASYRARLASLLRGAGTT